MSSHCVHLCLEGLGVLRFSHTGWGGFDRKEEDSERKATVNP